MASITAHEPPMLTVAEVAKSFSVTSELVRGWCHDGSLEAVNIGAGKKALWRIRPADLEVFRMNRSNQKGRKVTNTIRTRRPVPNLLGI